MTEYLWIGWLVIMLGWGVIFLIQRHYQHTSEICKLVDMFRVYVISTEDLALNYWVKTAEDIHSYQLSLNISRLSRVAMEIKQLKCSKYTYPTTLMKDFRRAVTLDADSHEAALPFLDERPRAIMLYSLKLQEHFRKPL